MFRHQGKSRTFEHNLRLATFLSFVAGIVNVTGFLAIKQLTTNVTGHFALFINDVANFDFWKGTVYFLYIFSFLLGSFVSSLLLEMFRENKRLNVFVIPTFIESLLLLSIPLITIFRHVDANLVSCLLLFAMGLQNSYVTKISNAVVRTTHLTGLFTDLGIDLAHLFFPKSYQSRNKLISAIKLRLYIIGFFFMGGLFGGYTFSRLSLHLNTLLIASIILWLSLFYDDFRFRLLKAKRKYKHKKAIKKAAG